MNKPVVYVAETKCCGFRIHHPKDLTKPCHARKSTDVDNKPYIRCKIIRYWKCEGKKYKKHKERKPAVNPAVISPEELNLSFNNWIDLK